MNPLRTTTIAKAVEEKGRALPLSERLDPSTTALVLIDLQNEFCHADGAFARLGHDVSMMPSVAEATHRLLKAARAKNMTIFFVRATYDGEVLSGPLAETYNRRNFKNSQCLEGSWDAGWYADLAPRADALNEIVITKHRFSAFWGTDFDLYLRSNGIRSLVFAGVVTSGCVESTLRDAFFRDYYVVCASDAVAEASLERHRASLAKIGQAFGEVLTAEEIAAVWARADIAQPLSMDAKQRKVLYELPDRLDPKHTALVLIDLQNDFCHVDGVMGQAGEDLKEMRQAVAGATKLLAWARQEGLQVIHVRAEYSERDASDVSLFASRNASGTACCRPDTWGANFVDEVKPEAHEWVVTKHRFSAFVDTRLDLLLRSNAIRSIVVGGVATQCCVESTVRDASLRDYYVTVVKDVVGARGRMKHLHDASLETMSLYFAECLSLDELREARHPRVQASSKARTAS
ncbi:MAG TPA: isochorismatase family protein [Lacipirellulaceae bacterium]|nr:isochorismatase family protein [Lacipirellulaceae bacterium]